MRCSVTHEELVAMAKDAMLKAQSCSWEVMAQAAVRIVVEACCATLATQVTAWSDGAIDQRSEDRLARANPDRDTFAAGVIQGAIGVVRKLGGAP